MTNTGVLIKQIPIGSVFGKLVVIGKAETRNYSAYWLCKCECGTIKEVQGNYLRRGKVKSCGCGKGTIRHGYAKRAGASKLYKVFKEMRQRCCNPKNKSYRWYGGKGIKITRYWDNFESFMKWALSNGYREGLTIDRVNSDLNYTPGNCRWITRSENTRRAAIKKLIFRPAKGDR